MTKILDHKKYLLSELLELAKNKEQTFKNLNKGEQKRANESEGAMQSRYSTFKEEGQYLASGLKLIQMDFEAIVSTIKSLLNGKISLNDKVQSLSIVELKFDEGTVGKFFVLPVLGGEKIDDLSILSPTSPLGKAILRKETGDQFSFKIGNILRKGEVTNVQ